MRIHRIELQAFGPFAGRETVDLEPLNEAGLFLLDGPTGAGKSTVLAAVCFALYGTLPGQGLPIRWPAPMPCPARARRSCSR